MSIINKIDPSNRQELKQFVTTFWEQCGLFTTVDWVVETNGNTTIDVYARDNTDPEKGEYLCECKYWSTPISQNELHVLKTMVLERSGAILFLLSKKSPSHVLVDDLESIHINHLTWQQFQDHFSRKWIGHQTDRIQQDAEDLRNYCDPLEKYVTTRLRTENDGFRETYQKLSEKYMPIGMLAHKWNLPNALLHGGDLFEIYECRDMGQFMRKLDLMLQEGLTDFDDLFCEKWRKRSDLLQDG